MYEFAHISTVFSYKLLQYRAQDCTWVFRFHKIAHCLRKHSRLFATHVDCGKFEMASMEARLNAAAPVLDSICDKYANDPDCQLIGLMSAAKNDLLKHGLASIPDRPFHEDRCSSAEPRQRYA